MHPVPDPLAGVDPASLRRHVDGGIYRFAFHATNADTGAAEAVYEHLHPFARGMWTRPADQFAHRFHPIPEAEARAALARPAHELQAEVASNKALRRAREAAQAPAAPKLHCIGFMFNPSGTQVALIRKLKPEWQRGRLNGIGGKTEPGETCAESMAREFKEEAGVDTSPSDWQPFARLLAPEFEAHAFRCFSPKLPDCVSATDEEVLLLDVGSPLIAAQGLSGLPGLIMAALDPDSPFHDILYRDSALPALAQIAARVG